MANKASQLKHVGQRLSNKEDLQSLHLVKSILEENENLKSRTETLQQQKHSLQMDLNVKVQMIESQNFEIESQKEAADFLTKKNAMLVKENNQISKKLKEKIDEIKDLQKDSEEIVLKNNVYEKKIADLEQKLKNSYEKEKARSNEKKNSEELLNVLKELNDCQNEKKNLMLRVSDLESKLDEGKLTENKFFVSVCELQEHLKEKNTELQTYSSIIEKTKEENAELLATIEIMKLEQVDEKRRGNSVFGEVDDRRKVVEREYITLKEKYRALKESHGRRLEEIQKLKNQFVLALSMNTTKESDLNYIEKLEIKLVEARKEVEELTNNLSEQQVKPQRAIAPAHNFTAGGDHHDEYGYLRSMLKHERKKIEDLQEEIKKLRFSNLAETNKLINTERKFYLCKKSVDSLQRELMKAKLQTEFGPENGECKEKTEKVKATGSAQKEQTTHKSGVTKKLNQKENNFAKLTIIDLNEKNLNSDSIFQEKQITIDNRQKDIFGTLYGTRDKVERKHLKAPSMNMNEMTLGAHGCTQQ